jgi:hypothetical protein
MLFQSPCNSVCDSERLIGRGYVFTLVAITKNVVPVVYPKVEVVRTIVQVLRKRYRVFAYNIHCLAIAYAKVIIAISLTIFIHPKVFGV